ncbi:uncharacterized protein SPSK_07653 [Sporothrix schenckii 1099-18]|uniref:Uncharacterized protein n=1 Tax=Sporothrix schenckii 1099-18 TaxID=1397361 RepID=A0A0F2ME09_SPOSC|nr:uncharacterized protein SPSK_07653 [Sporothrix schenckii 1099-18]KJR87923.1 hypothetical protein SPSK_07653 [Sporothrix schenckii 1099-18]
MVVKLCASFVALDLKEWPLGNDEVFVSECPFRDGGRADVRPAQLEPQKVAAERRHRRRRSRRQCAALDVQELAQVFLDSLCQQAVSPLQCGSYYLPKMSVQLARAVRKRRRRLNPARAHAWCHDLAERGVGDGVAEAPVVNVSAVVLVVLGTRQHAVNVDKARQRRRQCDRPLLVGQDGVRMRHIPLQEIVDVVGNQQSIVFARQTHQLLAPCDRHAAARRVGRCRHYVHHVAVGLAVWCQVGLVRIRHGRARSKLLESALQRLYIGTFVVFGHGTQPACETRIFKDGAHQEVARRRHPDTGRVGRVCKRLQDARRVLARAAGNANAAWVVGHAVHRENPAQVTGQQLAQKLKASVGAVLQAADGHV